MALPLSDTTLLALNLKSPGPPRIVSSSDYEVTFHTAQSDMATDSDSPPSSPFVANVTETVRTEPDDQENVSPIKLLRMTTKSPIDRESASPFKMLKSRTSPTSAAPSPRKPEDSLRSPRKLSVNRFPVKPSSPRLPAETTLNIEEVLRENEGLTKAIEILEDEDSDFNEEHVSDDTFTTLGAGREMENSSMDDTMVSTYSSFSAVPDMATFAKIGHSPSKSAANVSTPRQKHMSTPATSRRPPVVGGDSDPTPRGHGTIFASAMKDETNLLDFTEQFNGFSGRTYQTPARAARQSPLKNSSDLGWGSATPSARNNMSNLLDFDIPPAPTPRSMPSITPRELESLKSAFLSEISSLKASLSGKEAEVHSLKTAVGDAEKRVGQSMEQVREERSLKEQLAAERESWESRGREMESVLRSVRDEITSEAREREELAGRLEESERRREMAEIMAQETERKLAMLRAGKGQNQTPTTPTHDHNDSKSDTTKSDSCVCGGKVVEQAVEKVSRELHSLYKDKHEHKVAALKKSYERRWEKKIADLENRIEDLTKENEDFRMGRNTTMTRVEIPTGPTPEELQRQAEQEARTKELEAELEGLSQVVKSVKNDNNELRAQLDEERVEKDKLRQAVDDMIPLCKAFDEMLATQMEAPPPPAPAPTQIASPKSKSPRPNSEQPTMKAMNRMSGLRAPGSHMSYSGESRIGRGAMGFGGGGGGGGGVTGLGGGNHERSRSGSSHGSGRPGSGMGAPPQTHRSGIMSSIERMGSYKGRGGEQY